MRNLRILRILLATGERVRPFRVKFQVKGSECYAGCTSLGIGSPGTRTARLLRRMRMRQSAIGPFGVQMVAHDAQVEDLGVNAAARREV